MQAAIKSEFVSLADYLAAEEKSQRRHDYMGGEIYAKGDETRNHNQVIGNFLYHFRRLSREKPFQIYTIDVRVNFQIRGDEYFYYPDVVVTCDKRDNHPHFVRYPELIIEVSSGGIERVDRDEKFFVYTKIKSLKEYIIVSQTNPRVTVFRRDAGWKSETITGAKSLLKIASLGIKIPMTAIYEGV